MLQCEKSRETYYGMGLRKTSSGKEKIIEDPCCLPSYGKSAFNEKAQKVRAVIPEKMQRNMQEVRGVYVQQCGHHRTRREYDPSSFYISEVFSEDVFFLRVLFHPVSCLSKSLNHNHNFVPV